MHPAFCGLALGIGGQAILWRDLTTLYELSTAAQDVADVYGYLCHVITLGLLVTMLATWLRKKDLVELSVSELAALSTGPMALATTTNSLSKMQHGVSQFTWFAALISHVIITGLYIRAILCLEDPFGEQGRRVWCRPAVFPPTVGIAAMASVSKPIGMPEIAVVTEGMGVVWALLLVFPVLAVAYQEGGFQHNMPQTAILCAPFALCGAGFWAVSQQYSPDATKEWAFLFHLLYFSAIVCYLVVLVQMPSMLSQGVSEPPLAAALTFPFTIVGTAMVRAHTSLEPPAAGHLFSQIFAVFAACASVLVVWTVAARYLAHYLLKPPEEPATMAKPTSGEATEVGPNDSHGTTVHTSTVDVEMAAASPRHPPPAW